MDLGALRAHSRVRSRRREFSELSKTGNSSHDRPSFFCSRPIPRGGSSRRDGCTRYSDPSTPWRELQHTMMTATKPTYPEPVAPAGGPPPSGASTPKASYVLGYFLFMLVNATLFMRP